jgi:hypothetical protein
LQPIDASACDGLEGTGTFARCSTDHAIATCSLTYLTPTPVTYYYSDSYTLAAAERECASLMLCETFTPLIDGGGLGD